MFGFININKPSGVSSHKVVSVLRKITGIKQIGHAGTLDPLASGVLPVSIGKATKLTDYLPTDKCYVVGLQFGYKSDTYDIEGTVEKVSEKKIEEKDIIKEIKNFKGKIKQIPPAYSAVHYNGKRLYELARKGEIPCDIPGREVEIYENEIISFDYEEQKLKLKIKCSKGTYIRSIVNDLGNNLECGAVMYELTRIESGGFHIENAVELTEKTSKEEIINAIKSPKELIKMSTVEINDSEYKKFINGNKFGNNKTEKTEGEILILKDGEVIGLGICEEECIQPKKVLI